MSDHQEELDRSEQATAHKLEKAHERGSIVRSADVVFAVVLMAAVACVQALGEPTLRDTARLLGRGLSTAGHDAMPVAGLLNHTGAMASLAIALLAPLVFVIWFSAALAGALQARGVFSTEPLKPDFSRLDPSKGFKRVVSARAGHELVRSALKLVVVTGVCCLWGADRLGALLRASAMHPRTLAREGLALVASALALVACLFVLLAVLDYGFNRWEFMRQMRMSRREVKNEHKDREGDPRVRSRLRELRMEWLKRARSVAKVRGSDVLLTNPTHYAVALEYRHGEMPAPVISARGAGEIARRMRTEARRCGIPIVENPPLARALFAVRESDRYVPEHHFNEVARILRWVYATRASRGAGATA